MVEQEPGSYRPRRAFVEADTTPPAVPTPAPGTPPDPLEDEPPPLYRDEVAGRPTEPMSAAPAPAVPPPRPITFTPRKPRVNDPEATTILPRTGGARRANTPVADTNDTDDIDDFADDRRALHPKLKLGLLVAAVAAVVAVGLALMYAVSGVPQTQAPQTQTTPASSSGASTPPSGSPTPIPAPPTAALTEASMVGAKSANLVAGGRWKVAATETTDFGDSARPACFAADPPEGQPTAQQRILRVLSSGKNSPTLLHDASVYASADEAVQAYAVAARTLGSCPVTGSYVVAGRSVTGLGDDSIGEIVAVGNGSKTQLHTVVVNRTGRIVNIVDASQAKEALPASGVVAALAASTKVQCANSGGGCPKNPGDDPGPPPPGGDEPGFLAVGDLPPAGEESASWAGTQPEQPKENFVGTQCETVNWSTLAARSTSSRVYLQQNSGSLFGLNEIVATMKDEKAATALVEKVKDDLGTCKERVLTATVSKPEKVSSVGAKKTAVTGYTSLVSQQSTKGTTRYRMGIVAAGRKVAYTFLNPRDGRDFSADQWEAVALRAGERATQAK